MGAMLEQTHICICWITRFPKVVSIQRGMRWGDASSGAGAQKALKRPAAPTPQLWLVEECWWDAQTWKPGMLTGNQVLEF